MNPPSKKLTKCLTPLLVRRTANLELQGGGRDTIRIGKEKETLTQRGLSIPETRANLQSTGEEEAARESVLGGKTIEG